MTLNQEQLEWIVREVMRRLKSGVAESAGGCSAGRLSLTERLVTTETLRDRLEGVSQVDVIAKAIVTPAVVDLLRERKVSLVRADKK